MKQFWLSLVLLIGMMLYGCDSQPIPTHAPTTVGNILSRTTIGSESLSIESQALFHATGGLELNSKVLTLTESGWTDEEENTPLAFDSSVETRLTALYPVTNNAGDTITRNPYNQNALIDVLIAQDTLINSTDAHLLFRHRFSKLTFLVDAHLQTAITGITLTAPKIASIDPESGNVAFEEEGSIITTVSNDGSGQYTFIIPPYEDCNLTLTFNMSDETTKTHPLQHTFDRGCQYTCNVTSTDTRPGIRNASDLIAFCKLINEKPYTGEKSLSDFGEEVNGRMVYRLLADITLTEDDCKQLTPIGTDEDEKYTFSDIFDGSGYSITNLILPDKKKTKIDYTGLFGFIGANGIVKNLNITNARTIDEPTCKYIGVITGKNSGTITNCSVTNSRINTTYDAKGYYGIISSISPGYIINSFTQNDTINMLNEAYYCGFITSTVNGRILNCYSHKNSFSGKSSSNSDRNGCIAGGSSNTKNQVIANCYIYHRQNNSNWGAIIGRAKDILIQSVFYNKENVYFDKNGSNITIENDHLYDANFEVDGTHITDLLNTWITDTINRDFHDIEFKLWKTADDGSPCFQ